jgi:hypothetical protein
MHPVHLGVWFFASLATASVMLLVVRSAIQIIIFSLVSEQIGKAYLRLTVVGLFLISILSGVGFLTNDYRGFAKAPETNFGWFATAYNAAAASGTAILSYLGVIMFICLVSQVSVIRAKIIAEKR